DGEGGAVPARGVRAADHPLRHQAGERAPRRRDGAQGVRLRARQAVRQGGHPPDHHRRARHPGVRGAGAVDAAPRDAQVRRVQLRDAAVRDAREAAEPGARRRGRRARARQPGVVPAVGVAPVRGRRDGGRAGARDGGGGGRREGEGEGGEGVHGGTVVRAVQAGGQAVHGQRRADAGRGGPHRRAAQPVRPPRAVQRRRLVADHHYRHHGIGWFVGSYRQVDVSETNSRFLILPRLHSTGVSCQQGCCVQRRTPTDVYKCMSTTF
ncbi:Os04g0655400, partial [Oryza sativa Japonica Group]